MVVKMKRILVYIFSLIYLWSGLKVVDSANILGIFPSPGRSQFILGDKLLGELAKRGHNVTVISAYLPEEKIKNYETILVKTLRDDNAELLSWSSYNDYENAKSLFDVWTGITEGLASQQAIYDLIHSNSSFDLVLFESFGNEAQMGFAQHFNAPLVVFSSLEMNDWSNSFVGNVRLPSITSYSMDGRTSRMSFYGRIMNTVLYLFDLMYKEFIYYPKQQKILNQYFGKEVNLKEVMTNVSFLLLNSHPLTTEPSLLTSAAIEVGGFHISPKKLPSDIQQFLDGAKDGAILFSLGSNIDVNTLSNKTIEDLITAIGKLSQRVLWKCDIQRLSNQPKNLLTSKWLPQNDILAHPNIVAFVTHSGLLSTTEAIYHGVPMVATPIFGDQYKNALRAVEKGVAVHLDFSYLNGETFYKAVKEITSNEKYRKKSKELSKMFRDRPVEPLDLAIHTIEYVIKYKPAKYYRSPALDLSWFQLYLIDIFLSAVLSAIILKKVLIRDTRNKKIKQS